MDNRSDDEDAPAQPAPQRVHAERMGASSTLAVPLLSHGRVLGVLAVYALDDERSFDADDLALGPAIGSLAAQALDNGHAYAAAEEARRRLAATFESMVDAVYLYDATGQVLDLNEAAARLLGLPSRAEALGAGTEFLRFVELRHPDGRAIGDADRPSRRAVRGEMVAGFDEIVYNRVTGEERHVIVNAAPIPAPVGRPCRHSANPAAQAGRARCANAECCPVAYPTPS